MTLEGTTPPADDPIIQKDGAPVKDEPKVDPKYEGKSAEELITMLDERDKTIGAQGKRLGDVEGKIQSLETTRQSEAERERQAKAGTRYQFPWEMFQPGEGSQAPPGPGPEEKKASSFNYEKPAESVEEIYDRKRDEERKGQNMENLGRNVQAAYNAHEEGKRIAVKENPELFEGIVDIVEDQIGNTYGPGTKQGYDYSHILRNPDTWVAFAKNARVQKGDFVVVPKDRVKEEILDPVRPEHTELPAGAKPPEGSGDSVELDYNDPEVQKIIEAGKSYGLKEEDIEEIVKDEQERVRRGIKG